MMPAATLAVVLLALAGCGAPADTLSPSTTEPPAEPQLQHGAYWQNGTFTDTTQGTSTGPNCVTLNALGIRHLVAVATWDARPGLGETLRLGLLRNYTEVLEEVEGPSPLRLEWNQTEPIGWQVFIQDTGSPVLELPFTLKLDWEHDPNWPDPAPSPAGCGF
ncbi:MAG: hypothetical protein QOD77_1658 [Thermoplasmata archaeon]|jgi:hypothetical protein|nr:hypothetical protein [Thermoplasmata archaeon]